mgnify:CR=1 FL=1
MVAANGILGDYTKHTVVDTHLFGHLLHLLVGLLALGVRLEQLLIVTDLLVDVHSVCLLVGEFHKLHDLYYHPYNAIPIGIPNGNVHLVLVEQIDGFEAFRFEDAEGFTGLPQLPNYLHVELGGLDDEGALHGNVHSSADFDELFVGVHA